MEDERDEALRLAELEGLLAQIEASIEAMQHPNCGPACAGARSVVLGCLRTVQLYLDDRAADIDTQCESDTPGI